MVSHISYRFRMGYNTSIISQHSQQYINYRCKKNHPYCYSLYLHISFISFLQLFIDLFLLHFQTKDSHTHVYAHYTCDHHRMVTEISKTANFQACFFYNLIIYWLTNLLIHITFLYWQVFSGG